jgi:hypothetical protein
MAEAAELTSAASLRQTGMPSRTPEGGTLIISALLILALGFAGYWIMRYAQTGGPPANILPWFGSCAAVIVVVGVGWMLLSGRRR